MSWVRNSAGVRKCTTKLKVYILTQTDSKTNGRATVVKLESLQYRSLASVRYTAITTSGVDVKRIIIAAAFLILLYHGVSFTQEQTNPPANIYLGVSLGCSPVTIGFSPLFLDYGAEVLYALDNQFLMFSYSRVDAFNLKFDSKQRNDNSKMDRLELCYGRITCLKEDHKLFRNITVGAMIGVGYNSIRYYSTDLAFNQGKATNIHRFELPIGVTISNSLGKQTFMILEMKYHILADGLSYPDFKYFITFNIL